MQMATSGDPDHKILLVNNNRLPESNQMLFWKNMLTKKHHFYKEKYLIKKYRKFQVIQNFYSDEHWGGNEITNEVFSPRIS